MLHYIYQLVNNLVSLPFGAGQEVCSGFSRIFFIFFWRKHLHAVAADKGSCRLGNKNNELKDAEALQGWQFSVVLQNTTIFTSNIVISSKNIG